MDVQELAPLPRAHDRLRLAQLILDELVEDAEANYQEHQSLDLALILLRAVEDWFIEARVRPI